MGKYEAQVAPWVMFSSLSVVCIDLVDSALCRPNEKLAGRMDNRTDGDVHVF